MITTILTTLFIVYIIYNELRISNLTDQINKAFKKESKILDELVILLSEEQINKIEKIINEIK